MSKVIPHNFYEVIRRPITTEKSHEAFEKDNKVILEVSVDADKGLIKKAVEAIFSVNVKKINIINVKGKVKRFRGIIGKRKTYKKAIITLEKGQSIDFGA